MMISIIIPVYNQYSSLDVVLWHFCRQTIALDEFEIIIVDDGSSNYQPSLIEKYSHLQIKHIRIKKNRGRSNARNIAISNAVGEYIIFCDCDRLPVANFVEEHVKVIDSQEPILSIGYSTETYNGVDELKIDTANISRRKSIYYNVISHIYNDFGTTDSHLCWLSTLSGNMALKKSTLSEHRFDCDFKEWGFEHFELGYRLWKANIKFVNNTNAENIHIAHPRNTGFYNECIANSYQLFLEKHPVEEIVPLKSFMLGQISLQEYEEKINGSVEWMKTKKKPIRVNGINI